MAMMQGPGQDYLLYVRYSTLCIHHCCTCHTYSAAPAGVMAVLNDRCMAPCSMVYISDRLEHSSFTCTGSSLQLNSVILTED